ncbi:MAG: TraX family protein [Eubacteriales bacterium]
MSSFVLKIIAAVTMLIDHAGLLLFPEWEFMRIIGRLSFPLYAYCIAEGFRHTRNRKLYFLRVFLLGLACQIVYTIVDRQLYLGILIVFSISILLMACTDSLKCSLRGSVSPLNRSLTRLLGQEECFSPQTDKLLSGAVCVLLTAASFVLCLLIDVDYGFFGILLPVFTSLFEDRPRRLVMFTAALLALCIDMTQSGFVIQFWSLLAVPLLAMYNGKPGKYRMKYFFYVFYPAHLVLLYALARILPL